MPVSVRTCLFGVLLSAASLPASGQSVYLPAPPSGPGGEDVIETASGARCRQAINSNGAYFDLGVTGRTAKNRDQSNGFFPSINHGGNEATGYARVTMPLGRKPGRIDCSRLYELEIARMQREIELLKMAAE